MKYCWTTFYVRDMEKSLEFYRGLVGLKLQRRNSPAPGMEIAFLGEGETKLELILSADKDEPVYGKDISLGFEVSSLDAIQTVLEEKGIPLFGGPFEPMPGVRFLYVLDPDGVKIQFVESAD